MALILALHFPLQARTRMHPVAKLTQPFPGWQPFVQAVAPEVRGPQAMCLLSLSWAKVAQHRPTYCK